MSTNETWQDRQKRVAAEHSEMDRLLLRFQAINAQAGIDIFKPGWLDEYDAIKQQRREEDAETDRLIATPRVDVALAGMEEQFDA